MKAAGLYLQDEKLLKNFLGLQNHGGLYNHPEYENTRKLKILAHTRDKVVIHQNGVVWHQLHKINRGRNFAMQDNFARIAKISLG